MLSKTTSASSTRFRTAQWGSRTISGQARSDGQLETMDSSENSPLSLICNLNIPTRGDRKGLGMRQVKHGANSSGLVDCPARFETVRELLCCH